MKIVKGNKLMEFSQSEFNSIIKKYETVIIDLGTGDGRFVYKKAKNYPEKLWIGVDPSQRQLEIYSKKTQKEKLENVLFVLGSVEMLPNELTGVADELYISFPWGTLLETIAKPNVKILSEIVGLLVHGGILKILFGYNQDAEPTETQRLELVQVDDEYITHTLIPDFATVGLENKKVETTTKENLINMESTWGKKLAFGQNRPIYYLEFLNIKV